MIRVITSGDRTMEFTGRHDTTSRGGKGWEAVKRTSFVRIVPPPIPLVDWDELEGKKNGTSGNGQTTLFT